MFRNKRPMTIVSGDDGKLAPRPTRRSLAQILYDVILDIGGDGATKPEIMYMLPAELKEDDAKFLVTEDRLQSNLYQCVMRGYFLHNPQGNLYRIAPYSYYKARVNYYNDPDREREKRAPHSRNSQSLPVMQIVYRTNPLLLIGVAMAAFIVGMIVGRFVL